MRWLLRRAGPWLLGMLIVAAAAWGGLALHFALDTGPALRWTMIALWLGISAVGVWGLCARPRRWLAPGVFAVCLAVLATAWGTLQPRQDRDWSDDVAQRLHAQVQGQRVVLEHVRDFRWRSDSDYTPRWETRSYDLDHLVSADLVLSYWMGPAIAHTLISFGFDDGSHLVFSLEIRKQRGETFSALGGFFREFEQTLVAADERDILAVRTNVRGEDLYLYRLAIPPEGLRRMFLGYVGTAQALDRAPGFYNTLTSNCTTIVFELVRQIDPGLPLDWRLLLSGYLAQYAYDQHGLLRGYDLATLQRLGRVTLRARAAGDAADFSARIRAGMPQQDKAR